VGIDGDQHKRYLERSQRLDEEGEARLISLACSNAPAGHARWKLHLLSDKLVELGVVEPFSHECVRQVLKNNIKCWQKRMWCIPPKGDAHFVCQIEAILSV
jgi:hypothetical protein